MRARASCSPPAGAIGWIRSIKEARALGGDAVAVIGDAREEETAIEAVEAAKAFGRLDILINNVGVGNYKKLVDTSLDDYVEMMDANVRSTFLFSRHVAPVMIEQGDGLILMISSMAGVYGFPGEAVYCATKFAQVGFAQGLDKELRPHGIKVGTINPGGVKTEFALGKGRTEQSVAQSEMLEAEDVAAAVLLRLHPAEGLAHHPGPDAHDGRGAHLVRHVGAHGMHPPPHPLWRGVESRSKTQRMRSGATSLNGQSRTNTSGRSARCCEGVATKIRLESKGSLRH